MTTSRNQYATILSGDLDIEKDIWDVSQLDITKKREFSDSFDHGFADTRTYGNRKQAREKIKTYTKRGLFAGNDKSVRDILRDNKEHLSECIRTSEVSTTIGSRWIKMKLDDPRRKYEMYKTGFKWMDMGTSQPTGTGITNSSLGTQLAAGKRLFIQSEFDAFFPTAAAEPILDNWIKSGTNYYKPTNDGVSLTITDNNSDLTNLLKNKSGSYLENSNKAAYIQDKNVDIYNSDEFIIVDTTALSLTTTGWAYYDYYLHGDDVWILSRSKEEERQYIRDWEKNTRELRKRCIRIFESGSTPGHIWIKMKLDDVRRKEQHGGTEVSLDATTHKDLIAFLTTNKGPIITGETGYVLDSIINPETNNIITYGTEYVLDTLPDMPQVNYYDYYQPSLNGDVWVVSKSREEERKYMRDWETNSRELRKRCIRKRESGALASVKGHIWIKMKSDDPRRKEYHGDVQKITHNDTTHADLVSFLKETPTGISGTTGYVVDSIINPDTHKIMTYGTEYVFDTLPTTMPTINNYYDWYEPTGWQSGDYIWVVSKSTEQERAYMRDWETNSRELRKRCIRKRESGALASVKGHIWIKMKSDDPRRKEYHGDVQKITHNDTTHADLVSFLKETPTGISGTTGYVVDSIINPDTHKIMTYGTEYVFDTLPTTMPTINNYYDWYEPTGWQSGDYIWVVSKSTEQERAYMRDWETNSRELRKRCIRKRERGALASVKGHIWIKMKSDDPRRKEYHGGQKITHNDTTHADLVSFLKETPTGISGTTGYVVDSIINPDTHKIMTYGTEYVFDTLPTTMPTNDYYDWYEPTGWQSGDYIWVVSKSREEDRVDIRTIESVTETERNLYRNREASDVIQGGLREWQEDANRIGRRWTVRTWPPPLSSSELSNISNQQFLASLNLKQSNQSLTDGDFIDLTKSEFNTYDLDAVFTELYKMGRRWIVKNTQPTIGTQLDSSTTHSVLLGHLNSEGALLPEDTKISLSSHEFNNIYNLNLVNFDIQFGTWIGDGGGKYYVASRGGDAWIGPTTQGSYYFEATEGTQTNYTDYINFPGNDGGTDVHPS